ncbi:MAG: hypothetical protein SFU91_03085 [Chloroherpetonaceae bacterium]|nr:hypothetical protein [Chloroherpetonaceae bacterium]
MIFFTLFSLNFSNSPLLVLFFIVSFGIAFATYYKLPITSKKRWILTIARTIGFFLLLSLFLEPSLEQINRFTKEPRMVILTDNSKSMTIIDKKSNDSYRRDSITVELLSRLGKLKQFEKNYSIFGRQARDVSIDSLLYHLKFEDTETNISLALQKVLRENYDAAIVISDGRFNAGELPQNSAENSNLPIFTILIGDTLEKRDIILKKVLAPEGAVSGSKVPITAVISSQGFQGAKIDILLETAGEVKARKELTLTSTEMTIGFELDVTYDESRNGEMPLKVSILPVDGEFSVLNNTQSTSISVLKNKRKVVVFSGIADAEIGAVRNALASLPNFNSVFYSQKTPNDFYEGVFQAVTHQDADVAILIGLPNSTMSNARTNEILAFLQSKKIPVFTIFTFQTSGRELQKFDSFLALKNGRVVFGEAIENTAFLRNTPKGSSFIGFKPIAPILEEAITAAPPLGYLDYDFRPKSGTEILWKLFLNTRPTEKIAFAILNTDGRKTATLTTPQFWRLRLSEDKSVQELYRQTISGTIQWLMQSESGERFRVEPIAKVFDAGSVAEFSANLQDEFLQPVSKAEITLRAINLQTKQSFSGTFFSTKEAGSFSLSLDGLPTGDYRFESEAKEGKSSEGTILGKATGSFRIVQTGKEFRNTSADIGTMREIAERSGGKFYLASEFSSLESDLLAAGIQPKVQEQTSKQDLSASAWILFLTILSFGFEWLFRKLSSLP